MDIRQFELSNPWRVGRPWDVPSIRRRLLSEVIDWMDEPEALILTGARQVGKTSIIYQVISWLLESRGVLPADIYYFNLDTPGVADFVGDTGALLRFLDASGGRRAYVFIDEVQRLGRPGLLVKGLQDLRLPLKFILTGSSALDIRVKTGEALTGRKQVFHVFQLSFAEYLQARGASAVSGPLDGRDADLYLLELNHHLDNYATWGGYPAVVLSGSADKRLARLGEIYVSYLEKDIAGFLRVGNMSAFRRLVVLLGSRPEEPGPGNAGAFPGPARPGPDSRGAGGPFSFIRVVSRQGAAFLAHQVEGGGGFCGRHGRGPDRSGGQGRFVARAPDK